LRAYLIQIAWSTTKSIGLSGPSFKHQRQAQQLTHRPDMVGETGGHGGRSLPVAALQPWYPDPQGLVRTSKVVKGPPPVDMEQQTLL
jgi:hypothetical protein